MKPPIPRLGRIEFSFQRARRDRALPSAVRGTGTHRAYGIFHLSIVGPSLALSVAQDLKAKHMPPLLPTNKAATACDGKNFPINKGSSASCCQVGKDIVHINPTGGLSHRQFGRACSKLDGSTHCVGKECDFGPCGMRTVETLDGTNSFVFMVVTYEWQRAVPKAAGPGQTGREPAAIAAAAERKNVAITTRKNIYSSDLGELPMLPIPHDR